MASLTEENQPWAFLYRLGEMVREGRGATVPGIAESVKRKKGSGQREDSGCDPEAASRMVDDGCPNT